MAGFENSPSTTNITRGRARVLLSDATPVPDYGDYGDEFCAKLGALAVLFSSFSDIIVRDDTLLSMQHPISMRTLTPQYPTAALAPHDSRRPSNYKTGI
jgi:hypothetical protein